MLHVHISNRQQVDRTRDNMSFGRLNVAWKLLSSVFEVTFFHLWGVRHSFGTRLLGFASLAFCVLSWLAQTRKVFFLIKLGAKSIRLGAREGNQKTLLAWFKKWLVRLCFEQTNLINCVNSPWLPSLLVLTYSAKYLALRYLFTSLYTDTSCCTFNSSISAKC